MNDKLKHCLAGLIIGFVLININPYYGFAITVLILAGKEIVWDWMMKKGTCEWLDFVYGFVPVILILITKII